jgi:hypothetical protein
MLCKPLRQRANVTSRSSARIVSMPLVHVDVLLECIRSCKCCYTATTTTATAAAATTAASVY